MWCLVIFVQRARCCTCIWIMDSWPDGMCCYMSFIIASHETVRGILQWRTDTLCPTPVTLLHRYRDSTAVPGAEDNAAPKFAAHIHSQPASLLSMIQLACTPPPSQLDNIESLTQAFIAAIFIKQDWCDVLYQSIDITVPTTLQHFSNK